MCVEISGVCVCVCFSKLHLQAHQWEISPHIWILGVQMVRLSQSLLSSTQVIHLHKHTNSRQRGQKFTLRLSLFWSNSICRPTAALTKRTQPIYSILPAFDSITSHGTTLNIRHRKKQTLLWSSFKINVLQTWVYLIKGDAQAQPA